MFFAWQGNGPLGRGLHALGWVREGVAELHLGPTHVRGVGGRTTGLRLSHGSYVLSVVEQGMDCA